MADNTNMTVVTKKYSWIDAANLIIHIFLILVASICVFGLIRKYEQDNKLNGIPVGPIIKTIPGPSTVVNNYLNRKVKPDTIYVDTGHYQVQDIVSYSRPCGIWELQKDKDIVRVIYFRAADKSNSDIVTKAGYRWTLKNGSTWTIKPTSNPNDPFSLTERRFVLNYHTEVGYSGKDYVYMQLGVGVPGIKLGKVSGEVILSSFVSFPQQDLRLSYKVDF